MSSLPLHTCKGVCVFKSQNLTVVSPDPLANCLPVGLNCVDMTASAWPGIELSRNIFLEYLHKLNQYNKKSILCKGLGVLINFILFLLLCGSTLIETNLNQQ